MKDLTFIIIVLVLFIISFILALRSLSELEAPAEIKYIIERKKKISKKIFGIIIFLRNKIIHYSSSSEDSSS